MANRSTSRRHRGRRRLSNGGTSVPTTRRTVENIFRREGVPGWLGWGTLGAETSYGTNNPGNANYFGLIMPSYNGEVPNSSLVHDATIAARLYRKLISEYGLAGAVSHYSGGNYDLAHVKAMAFPTSGATKQLSNEQGGRVLADIEVGPFSVPAPGPNINPLFPSQGIIEGLLPNTKELAESLLPEGIGRVVGLMIRALELIIDVHFWLRAGEVIAGVILIHMGLKNLGADPVPSEAASRVTAAAGTAAAVVK